LLPGVAAAAVTLPPGFVDEPVAAVPSPTALSFTPDGRLLVTSQTGQLWVVAGGTLPMTPALDLSSRLCANVERGLVGVTVDPAFASNGALYLFYTLDKSNSCPTDPAMATSPSIPVNRVSRFTLGGDNRVDPASEVVLVDNIPSPVGQHIAGDMHFGKDGYLYITVGDGGCDYAGGGCAGNNDAARDRNVLLGKVLRIGREGGIPPDNPFAGAASARCNLTQGDPALLAGHRTVGAAAILVRVQAVADQLREPFLVPAVHEIGVGRAHVA
jgi:glucose/arabinose dehydrogenase